MRIVRIISLIARVALMATMVLGLLHWIAQIPFLSILSQMLALIGLTNIHELLGVIGVVFLLVLALVAIFTRGIRLLGAGSAIYSFLVPTFGLTQSQILVGNLHWLIQIAHLLVGIGAMYLARGIEKHYQRLKQEKNRQPSPEASAVQVSK
ncbi:MAG TPA: hypothetical protein VFB12_18715 [Ktedonobacteraceae bacterium]|nr:hypothetical protein [Ktedonobacteraceae bacterium]